ncbi:hypothetical protein [Kribbella sp. NPDC006257]|uniref:hypothetical protein n=1 Tax=Kribbella sp. NPDC006257 TaxID=3156738 RepID=UPI0033B7BDCE
MIRTVPADAVAIVRAYPPIVICFAAALAGTALVFDVFYLVASPGLALALVYTVPVLAGLIAGLVAASDDVGLERKVLGWTVAATIAVGITNAVVVAMIAAMRRTGPSDWAAGFRSILLAGCSVLAVAITIVVIGNLIPRLGIDLRTKLPQKKKKVYVPPPALAAPKPPVSKEAAARAKPAPPAPEPEDTLFLEEPYAEPAFVPPPPKIVDLDEPREVVLRSESTPHADRLVPRPRRAPSVPPSRRPHRPGRRDR